MSANMSNRLSEAIINAYRKTQNRAVDFELILREYTFLQPDRDREKDDSIKSVLKQLIRSNLFAKEDSVDLIKESFIIKMNGFPKEVLLLKQLFILSFRNSTLFTKSCLNKQLTKNMLNCVILLLSTKHITCWDLTINHCAI